MSVSSPPDDADVADRWDRALRVLSRRPRRALVIALMDRSSSAWVQLPDAAGSPHYDGSEDDLGIALHHQHLPVLAEHGYVVWAESPFEARQGPNFDEVEAVTRAVLESAEDLPDRLVAGCPSLEGQVGD